MSATDDYGDTQATAQPLSLNKSISGEISAVAQGYDEDMFKLTLTAGVYTVQTGLGGPGQLTSGYLSVINQIAGTKNEFLSLKENTTTFSFVAPVAGDYYISIGGDSYSAESRVGAYSLRVMETHDDYGFLPGQMGTLTVGSSVQGNLEAWLADDIDGFAIQLQGGVNYSLRLGQAFYSGGYYSPNGILTLVDSAGKVVAAKTGRVFNDEDLMIDFTPSASGQYYLHVADGNSNGGTGAYKVSANVVTGDEAGATATTARTLPGDGAFRGKLDTPSDTDVFHITVSAGETYAIGVQSTAAGQVSVDVLDGSNYATMGLPMPGNDLRFLTAGKTGDVYFQVRGMGTTGSTPYTLTAERMPADDLANRKEWAKEVLKADSVFHGNIDYAGDQDWIKVPLQAGTAYTFQAWGEAAGGNALPMGQVNMAKFYTIDGIAGGSIGNTAYGLGRSYTPTISGDYYISVEGAATGHYAVQMRAIDDDHTAPVLQSIGLSKVAAGVLPNTDIKLSFDEYVTFKDNLYLKDQSGTIVQGWGDWTAQFEDRNVTLKIAGSLHLGQTYTLEIGPGNLSDVAGNGIATTIQRFSTIPGSATGSVGNDYMEGPEFNGQLDGKSGIDTAVYHSNRSSYTLKQDSTGYSIGFNGSQYNDHLANIERVLFKDTALALDIDGAAGQGYRLYRAAFDRAPDNAGVGYWITQLDNGIPLRDVAASFIASNEFQARYGANLDNTAFTLNLYQNVLHRAPDQQGQDYWVKVLDGGAQRADVLMSFSESPENKSAVAAIIGNGFEYTPYG